MRIEPTTWLCDACATVEPTTRYDVPPNTPLLTVLDTKTGNGESSRLAGAFGLCDACRPVAEGFQAARALAEHVVNRNPRLRIGTTAQRTVYRQELRRLYERLLPLLTNPRPCVRGDDPMDAKKLVIDVPAQPDPPGAPGAYGSN